MKKLLMAVCTIFLALGLSAGNVEAARMGGGKSLGMQRQAVAPKPAAPSQQATPAAPTAPAAVPAAAPKRNWMGPLAGLAAGLGIAALLSHFGMGEGMANILLLGLLAAAAFFVVRLLFRRSAPAQAAEPKMQYAGAGGSPGGTAPPSPLAPPQPASPTAAATAPAQRVPADFDSEAFLRVAKLNFVRLQTANDAGNIDDIREFVSPELFAEIKMQIDERGNVAQQTDVVTLNAELLEVTTESDRHIASVHFSGMIREAAGATTMPFDEVWNLSKPADGKRGWVIAGIQQLS
jgi:predicted lipid-binding transport protein (Tim44 family)